MILLDCFLCTTYIPLRTYVSVCVCSKLFHVRPVTQGDVYRAESKDIPCIFQVHLTTDKITGILLLREYVNLSL